tara:strand:+ start:6457 stop:6681 length:225 start_codon:yes stop_codon:yes gene_type:complete
MNWQDILKTKPPWLIKYIRWLREHKNQIITYNDYGPKKYKEMQAKLFNPSKQRIAEFKKIAKVYPFYVEYGGFE